MEKHELPANVKRYGCVVDLLGRSGRQQDAYRLIQRMPMKPNAAICCVFLGACRIHMDTDMVEWVMEEVGTPDSRMDSGNDPHYMLLSNIHAASDSWKKAEKFRMVMLNKGLQKTTGCSSIMIVNTEQQFHDCTG